MKKSLGAILLVGFICPTIIFAGQDNVSQLAEKQNHSTLNSRIYAAKADVNVTIVEQPTGKYADKKSREITKQIDRYFNNNYDRKENTQIYILKIEDSQKIQEYKIQAEQYVKDAEKYMRDAQKFLAKAKKYAGAIPPNDKNRRIYADRHWEYKNKAEFARKEAERLSEKAGNLLEQSAKDVYFIEDRKAPSGLIRSEEHEIMLADVYYDPVAGTWVVRSINKFEGVRTFRVDE